MLPKLEPFANRLAKMHKHWSKWARRQGITCYRIYDNDIPGTPLAVDLYENIVHVAEYARDHGMEPDEHAEWLQGCAEVISQVTGIHTDSIYIKYRQRQKGLQQYERFSRTGAEFLVRENGLRFAIRPADYLDVGLFLDHRNTRQMVREEA
ncbi:MAG TPA: SAM-dependent methyltransferase, partial [Saprospiraceae bacterium]|nr:SAM-dependent methyltransferase [Saprospiraceae bacterium]